MYNILFTKLESTVNVKLETTMNMKLSLYVLQSRIEEKDEFLQVL